MAAIACRFEKVAQFFGGWLMEVGLRAIWPLFIGVMFLYLGHGLQGSLMSLQASALNFSSVATGFVMSGFYVGLFAGSIVSPRIIGQVGHIRTFAAFASMASTAILLIPLWLNPFWWFVMRVLIGVCITGLSIIVESWLNAASSNQDRGKMLSVYMIIAYAAVGLGNFFLNVGDTSGFVRFIVVSALFSLSLVPISLAKRVQAPPILLPRAIGLNDLFRLSPLALVGTLAAGLGQSAFFSMGSIFGVLSGLSIIQISMMMALPSLAVIFSQYPVGSLSDRFDRRIVMIVLTFLSLVTTCIALIVVSTPVVIITLLAFLGAVSFPIYSLAMAHANDYLDTDQMLGASAKLVLIYGVGAMAGPIIAGYAMALMGASGFMAYLAVVYGGLAVYALGHMLVRPDTPDDTGEYIPVAPQVTPVGAQVVAEEYDYESE
jgi:MFS family permease